jgi:long-subunit fatty acid transport protein
MFAVQGHAQLKPDPTRTPTVDFSGLPLDLLPPGARSLGLGGAFTAVADDATAALANPAGLTNLTAAEVSFHVRNTDATVPFLDSDAYDSGVSNGLGRLDKQFDDSTTDVSFASFVIPFEKFVFSGFYSNQVRFESVQALEDVIEPHPDFWDRYTNFNSIEARMDSIGLSLAYSITDSWSFGVTVQRSKLDMTSEDFWRVDWYTDIENALGAINDPDPEDYLAVIEDVYEYRSDIDDSDSDLTYGAGLYFAPNESLSLGLVYRRGASFGVRADGSVNSYGGCKAGVDADLFKDCKRFFDVNVPEDTWFNNEASSTARMKVPNILTLGIAFRPSNRWLLSLDVNRIYYSDATPPRSITQGLGLDINNQALRALMTDPPGTGPLTEEIKDATTFNFGVERDFVFDSGAMQSLTLRAGAYTIDDHDGIVNIDSDDTAFTVGIGTVWGKRGIGESAFQVDLAASFADDADNIILSGIYRF